MVHVRDTRGMCEGHAGDTRVVQYASYRKCRAAGTKEASMGRGSLLKCFGSHAHQLSTWHRAQLGAAAQSRAIARRLFPHA